MTILESIAVNETNSGSTEIDHTTMQRRVALVDGMAEIQGRGKSEWINNCLSLSGISITECNISTLRR